VREGRKEEIVKEGRNVMEEEGRKEWEGRKEGM
jgi:hypothetical protein